jgi:hypothetical protein
MKILRIATLLTGLATSLLALEDTPENRAKLVKHYLETFPVEDMWQGFERNIEGNFPEQQRELARRALQDVNWKVIIEAMRQILIETYTVDEIQALTEAYGSSIGRSILRKQGSFLSASELQATQKFLSAPTGQSLLRKQERFAARMQPIIRKEVLKAAAKVTEEMVRSKHRG